LDKRFIDYASCHSPQEIQDFNCDDWAVYCQSIVCLDFKILVLSVQGVSADYEISFGSIVDQRRHQHNEWAEKHVRHVPRFNNRTARGVRDLDVHEFRKCAVSFLIDSKLPESSEKEAVQEVVNSICVLDKRVAVNVVSVESGPARSLMLVVRVVGKLRLGSGDHESIHLIIKIKH
jgi:hypothetical protein